jgi:hypothetical protein
MNTIRTNIKRRASTQYSNFDFRSMCRVGDKVFGAGPGGLYRLTCENDDDGADVDAYVKTFELKLGHDGNKRCRFIYMNLETDGTVLVTPIVDGVEKPQIAFVPKKVGRQFMRMPVGKTTSGSYWQFKIENVNGCWFYLDKVEVLPIKLSLGR